MGRKESVWTPAGKQPYGWFSSTVPAAVLYTVNREGKRGEKPGILRGEQKETLTFVEVLFHF